MSKRNTGNNAVYGCKAIRGNKTVRIAGFPQFSCGRWYIDIIEENSCLLTCVPLAELIMPNGLNEFIPVLNKESDYLSEMVYIDTLLSMLGKNEETTGKMTK